MKVKAKVLGLALRAKLAKLSNHEACLLAITAIMLCSSLYLEWCRQDLMVTLSKERVRLNNTARAGLESLFFNRIPKAGSFTVMVLMKALSVANNFTFVKDREELRMRYGEAVQIPSGQRELYGATFNRGLTRDAVYNKHTAFMDFAELDPAWKNPIYMNFVREPVDRYISWYYYTKQTTHALHRFSENRTDKYSPKMYKLTLQECLESDRPECRLRQGEDIYGGDLGEHKSQMIFLCGNHDFCNKFNDERAFRKAVENLEKHYAVVGVLEEPEKSLQVLEAYIPRYFSGVSRLYSTSPHLRIINKTQFKPPMDEEVRALMRQSMSNEVRFYEYCRKRLHKQYLALL